MNIYISYIKQGIEEAKVGDKIIKAWEEYQNISIM